MAYATAADLAEETSEQRLLELTDDEGGLTLEASAVQAILTDQLQDASDLIDSYISQRYVVPLSPVPDVIESVCETITLYKLYLRRETVPDSRRDAYRDAIRWLEAVAAGKVSLPGGEVVSETAGGPQSSTTGVNRIFTRDTLVNY